MFGLYGLNKCWAKPKGKSNMANPETLTTLGHTRHRTKKNKTTQHSKLKRRAIQTHKNPGAQEG